MNTKDQDLEDFAAREIARHSETTYGYPSGATSAEQHFVTEEIGL